MAAYAVSRPVLGHSRPALLLAPQRHYGWAGRCDIEFTCVASPRQVSILAFQFWESRGSPHGSPEVDWFRALDALRAAPWLLIP